MQQISTILIMMTSEHFPFSLFSESPMYTIPKAAVTANSTLCIDYGVAVFHFSYPGNRGWSRNHFAATEWNSGFQGLGGGAIQQAFCTRYNRCVACCYYPEFGITGGYLEKRIITNGIAKPLWLLDLTSQVFVGMIHYADILSRKDQEEMQTFYKVFDPFFGIIYLRHNDGYTEYRKAVNAKPSGNIAEI